MNIYNMKRLFLLASNSSNRNTKCAVKCRITYNKERREFVRDNLEISNYGIVNNE